MRKTAFLALSLLLAGSLGLLARQAATAPAPAPVNQQPARATASVVLDPQIQAALQEIARGGPQMSTTRPVYPRTWVCSISCLSCGGIGGFCPRGAGHCVPNCP
jgi:hypothetical protein